MDPALAEHVRRSGVVWLRWPGDARDRLVWHLWHDGALWLVGGPGEQDLGPVGERVTVLVRDPESRTLAGSLEADVERVRPGTPEWEDAVPRLHALRLNPDDLAGQQERWAREGVVLRLLPD